MSSAYPEKGELFRCNRCNNPLAKLGGDKVFLLKHRGGKISEMEMEMIHGKDRGHLKLKCENCGSNNFFTTRNESIKISDNFFNKLKKRLWKN